MIGIVGIGAMGSAMATRLLEKGHDVLGYDSATDAGTRIAAIGAVAAASPADLAQRCRIILLSLPNAAIVTAVMTQLRPQLKTGSVIVDTSTSEPDTSRTLATDAERAGYDFLDAPVSGGPLGARSGTMSMIVGGDVQALTRVEPVLKDLTGTLLHIGPSGAGHTVKIANNLLCAANLVLVSEMAELARRSGVDLQTLLKGVNAGSGRSAVSEVNFPRWIVSEQFNSGFSMGLMRKDVRLASTLCSRLGAHLPATQAIADIWSQSAELLDDQADFNHIYQATKHDNA